jgi:hypothetical protein
MWRLSRLAGKAESSVRAIYQSARTDEHRAALSDMVMELVEKYGFQIRLGRVLDHKQDKKKSVAR